MYHCFSVTLELETTREQHQLQLSELNKQLQETQLQLHNELASLDTERRRNAILQVTWKIISERS